MRARVLYVITRLELGGAQRVVLHTAGHLDRGRFETGLAWGPGDVLDAEARRLGDVALFEVTDLVRPMRPARDLRALGALRAVMRDFNPRVVHTHSSKAGFLGRLAARLERVPVVVHTIHGFGFTPIQPAPVRALFFAAERAAARWTDHFIAVARPNLGTGVELGLFAPHEASVIRAGVSLRMRASAADASAARARLGIPSAASVVIQVGNFKPQKAPLDFVRMAARVATRHPEAWFVMVGEGPLRAAAEALAHRLGVAHRLVLPGWWDDVPALLAATTVSVLGSRHEGLPCAVVESLAAGVPVVATAVDGTVEVVREGVNGYLVAPGDVDALAQRVGALLAQPELRRRLAAAAPVGLEEFDIDLMVSKHEDLYQWLLGRSRS